MQKKYVVLAVLALLVVVVYGWMFLRPGPAVEVNVMVTPQGATFMFNGRVKLYEVVVTATPAGSAEDAEGEIVWHLVPRDVEGVELPDVTAVTYGEPRGMGLRPAPGTRGRGRSLEPGMHYEFEADTSGGTARGSFDTPGL